MTKTQPSDQDRSPIAMRDSIASSSRESSLDESRKVEAPSSRQVLPKDLNAAMKQLSDQELDRLVSAALEERSRRSTVSEKKPSEAKDKQFSNFLPQGKLNAVRAAFKAGVTP